MATKTPLSHLSFVYICLFCHLQLIVLLTIWNWIGLEDFGIEIDTCTFPSAFGVVTPDFSTLTCLPFSTILEIFQLASAIELIQFIVSSS